MVPTGEAGEDGYMIINITSTRVDYIDTENITFWVEFEDKTGLAKNYKIAMDQQFQREFHEVNVFLNKVVLKPDEEKRTWIWLQPYHYGNISDSLSVV